ncbi:DeoR/GlpR family DNA-binding transcription regulator [Isoptericola chiayiensis]|uniref:DeoR/GlpR family DNA-binding transcription regulator n=1 Tax=Isoptericola chiayiensis TaxID=579446 RepID=A0ABP8YLL7_9MICO|nr:DeoR/GlpR family transcriptional regulator of sugar metabolism [Isoptericola chiayiensis]
MVAMLPAERRSALLDHVATHGSARVVDLASALGVSRMTVRRDIDELAEQGLLLKVHGGAMAIDGDTSRPAATGWAAQEAEKEAIARAAASLVEPGMSVGLSGGSTAWHVAHRLRTIPDVTVVTNSLPVAELFDDEALVVEARSAHVVLTGGVRTPARALVGPVAVRTLEVLHCDVVFVGVHGLDPRAGLTTPNLLEAETNRALLAAGERAVVVADHSKWHTVSLTTVADLDAADVVISDAGLAPEAVAEIEQHGPEVVVAPPPE